MSWTLGILFLTSQIEDLLGELILITLWSSNNAHNFLDAPKRFRSPCMHRHQYERDFLKESPEYSLRYIAQPRGWQFTKQN